ncbi:DUF4469 domain-containing protein [Nocardioides yefusunii]|uniref:DUF4469 domain-containing protein n=1 Tax=Nocardioides yefusunii TaxID=2500546 RepID=A0ABW1QVI1_9ACTN|nr:DUF4469 domain-containing protein [Nocardioides yefusunii]
MTGKTFKVSGKAKGVRTVTVQKREGQQWRKVKTVKVKNGSWKATLRAPKKTGRYTLRVTTNSSASKSVNITVRTRTKITLVVPQKMTSEDKAKFTGRTTKAKARTVVKLQRKSAGKWVTLAKARTNKAGRYTIKHTPTPGSESHVSVCRGWPGAGWQGGAGSSGSM